MDAFSYLFVLVSIILGLAIEQVLQAYRSMALARDRVRWNWLSIGWSAILLLFIVQDWWASFGLAGREHWDFAAFAALLLQTSLLYMLAALVLPDMPAEGRLDLKEHYYRQRPVFFTVALIGLASSALREWVVEGHMLQGSNLAFHALFAIAVVLALLSRRAWVHHAVAAAMGLLIISYIALLYAEL